MKTGQQEMGLFMACFIIVRGESQTSGLYKTVCITEFTLRVGVAVTLGYANTVLFSFEL
jgi:hypothetical protein